MSNFLPNIFLQATVSRGFINSPTLFRLSKHLGYTTKCRLLDADRQKGFHYLSRLIRHPLTANKQELLRTGKQYTEGRRLLITIAPQLSHASSLLLLCRIGLRMP